MTLLQQLLEWLNAPQRARLLRLSYPNDDAPAARLLPNHFEGYESLSRGFRYTVELLSDDAGISLEEMHGKLLCVSLVQAGGSLRPFTGYVWQPMQLLQPPVRNLCIIPPWQQRHHCANASAVMVFAHDAAKVQAPALRCFTLMALRPDADGHCRMS